MAASLQSYQDQSDYIRTLVFNMLRKKPFFGFVISKMIIVESKHSPFGEIRTAATDGKHLVYSKEFFDTLKPSERLFVLAHEVMHCVLDSMGRKFSRDHQYWNMATDYVINSMLIEEKVGDMPKVGLYDKKYNGWAAEEVYADLLKSNAGKKETLDVHLLDGAGEDSKDKKDSGGPDGEGGVITLTKEHIEENMKDFKQTMIEAYQRAKMAGDGVGTLESIISDFLTPKIDWRQLLISSLQSAFRDDMTWNRPNRRNPCGNMILPSRNISNVVDICIAIDTSGSISDEQRQIFLSEVSGIMQYYTRFKIKIWTFDTQVHNMQEYDQTTINELSSYKCFGGGGTDIGINFDYMEEIEISPHQFVCFTDMYDGGHPRNEPSYPVTWIVHSNSNPNIPFGNFALYDEYE